MPITTIITAITRTIGNLFAPVSLTSEWQVVREAGTLTVADNATITSPSSQITEARCKKFDVGACTRILLRVRGPVATTSGSVSVGVYGYSTDSEVEQLLYTLDGLASVACAIDGASIKDATYVVSTVSLAKSVDRLGCKWVRFGVLSAFSGANADQFVLEAKVI